MRTANRWLIHTLAHCRGWLTVCVMALGAPAQALVVEQLQARFHEGEYQLTMTARLAAPLQQVQRVLRDYGHYPELDARILEAQVLARPAPHQLELLTRINVCFAFFCRKVARVELVEERNDELLARVIPERSDAERGQTHAVLSTQRDSGGVYTQVIYTTSIVPGFWVPALVGRSLMLRNLREATVALFTSIERRAAVATP